MMRIVRTVVMAAATLSIAAGTVVVAAAQDRAETAKAKTSKKAAKAAAGSQAGGSNADAALDKARRALDEGKAVVAQQLAESVLTSASKDPRSTARALAVRGEAYLGQGRPAEALADLESALWVKGGLQGNERASATMARGKAMEQAGLAKASPVIAAPAPLPAPPVAPPSPVAAAKPLESPQPPAEREAPAKLAVARSVLSEPEAPRAEPKPLPAAQPSTWNQSTTVARTSAGPEATPVGDATPTTVASISPPLPRTATAPADRSEPRVRDSREAAESTAPPASNGTLTGFLSGLFGGGASSGQEAPTTTASVGSTRPRPTTPAVSSSEPQRIEPAARPQTTTPVRTAALVAPSMQPQIPAQVTPAGTYRLQLAAVRTKAEAEEMVAKVREEEPAVLGQRNFEIVEDVYGNMGRFYRVRIGSFGEPTEALSICATLRDKRMDCMVLDR
jgi:hypothetical protein